MGVLRWLERLSVEAGESKSRSPSGKWRKGGASELALCGPSPAAWHIGCLFVLLLALVLV